MSHFVHYMRRFVQIDGFGRVGRHVPCAPRFTHVSNSITQEESMSSNSYDVIVVGAGSNSLVTAAYLAKAGKNVLVLEKNDQCGGGVVSIEIAPGFTHDPH